MTDAAVADDALADVVKALLFALPPATPIQMAFELALATRQPFIKAVLRDTTNAIAEALARRAADTSVMYGGVTHVVVRFDNALTIRSTGDVRTPQDLRLCVLAICKRFGMDMTRTTVAIADDGPEATIVRVVVPTYPPP